MKTIGERYQYQLSYCVGVHPTTKEPIKGFGYSIYLQSDEKVLIIESEEWFDNEVKAGLAAIGHISLLEKEISYD